MRINWFSPLPPARTGVARYAMHVLEALSHRADVTLWTDVPNRDPRVAAFGKVRLFDRFPDWAEMNRADATFYNIGNNVDFHGRIWEISRRHAGIAILHDTHLQHLFAAVYAGDRARKYRAMMTRHYGPAGRRAADAHAAHRLTTVDLSARYPLTPLAVDNALGVVVHSPSQVASLARSCRRPVAHVPLPYAASAAPAPGKPAGPPYRVVMFGHLGPNRRLDSVLRALEGLERRDALRLDVYGRRFKSPPGARRLDFQQRLRRAALRGIVTFHGYVPDHELEAALASAHLAINLRYPSMGEASWSQLQLWSHALPSLVTRTGWYATLPPQTVCFVDPGNEVPDLRRHLNAFLDDPAAFARRGESARRALRARHGAAGYADALLDLARDAGRFRGRVNSFQLASRVAAVLAEWPVAPKDLLLERTATEIHRLCHDPAPTASVNAR